MFKKIFQWWKDNFTNEGTLNSIYEKITSYEQGYKQLKKSEIMYKRVTDEMLLQERILEVLIGVSNAIAVGTITEEQVRNTALIAQKVFNITEIYYARICDGKFEKKKSFVCPEHAEIYTAQLAGDLTELPELVEDISRGICHVVDNNDFSSIEKLYYQKLNIKSVYCCPVIIEGKLHGVVGFNKLDSCMWKNAEASLCQIFASLVSTAVRKDMLIKDLTKAKKDIQDRCYIMQNTVDMIDGCMWNKGADGRYKFCTPTWKSLFFRLPDNVDIIGKTPQELVAHYERITGKEHTYKSILELSNKHCIEQKKTCYYIEVGYVDDKILIIDAVKTPLFDIDDKFVGMVGVIRDRSNEAVLIDSLLKEYIKRGLAINLTEPDDMATNRVASYWIKNKHEHDHLLDESSILPR